MGTRSSSRPCPRRRLQLVVQPVVLQAVGSLKGREAPSCLWPQDAGLHSIVLESSSTVQLLRLAKFSTSLLTSLKAFSSSRG